MIAISITGLNKSYGQVRALDGLDLEIPEGSVFGLLGPNGAGKTTTLRILVGLAKANSGKVEIFGEPLSPFRVNEKIGYLSEEPAFYSWMTPIESLDYIARIYGLRTDERKKRIAELIDLSGLQNSAKRRIGGFSRGMRQRLGLAHALVNHPSILLLDEPLSALDPIGRKDVMELIEHLGKETTVLMSTHILADVERVCDTVAIMNNGKRIIQSGREELLQKYASSALEIEFANGEPDNLDVVAEMLRRCSSVKDVTREGHTFRISVSALASAQQQISQLIVKEKWQFERLDVVKPTLEDVFVRLVGEEGKKK